MSPLLQLINHLLDEALRQHGGPDGVELRALVLDAEGMRVVAALGRGAWQGELVLRLDAEPAQVNTQSLRLRVEQLPKGMPGALEPFRKLLAGARLRLELDFTP